MSCSPTARASRARTPRGSRRALVAAALLGLASALASAPASAQSIVVNGSMEIPAHTGDGYMYSTDPAFSLPGWTYPTGGNQFFLEWGQPFGFSRHYDGRQAVCLNGDGTPVSLSQVLPTDNGASYILTFALGEERFTRPSPTTVLVSAGSTSQSFALGSAPGYYAVFTMNFTATSTSTLLRFTDTTPGSWPYESPFIDNVAVVPDRSSSGVAEPLAGTRGPVLKVLPNPSHGATAFEFTPGAGALEGTIDVFDVRGARVRRKHSVIPSGMDRV